MEHTKIGQWLTLALLAAGVTVSCTVSITLPQSVARSLETAAEQLRDNVFAVEAFWSDGSSHDGFGFVTGSRDGVFYIATANHVVRSEFSDITSKTIKLRLRRHKGRTFDAQLLDTHDVALDLAVLTAKIMIDIDWRPEALGRMPEFLTRGNEVSFIGRNTDWYVPVRSGIVDEVDNVDHEIIIEDLSVHLGSSGAPLIASGGIVGMVVRDTTARTVATQIKAIEDRFRRWGHAWDLKPVKELPLKKSAEESTPFESTGR